MNFHFDSLKNTKIIIILKQAIIQIRHREYEIGKTPPCIYVTIKIKLIAR